MSDVPTPIVRPQDVELSCTLCDITVTIRGYLDPERGDGWPQHRCKGYVIRAFDTAVLAAQRPPKPRTTTLWSDTEPVPAPPPEDPDPRPIVTV